MDRNEKEKMKKIRQLEDEIIEMQIDHAETFGYAPPEKRSSRILFASLFAGGVILLAAGLLWIFSNLNFTADLAVMKIGKIRFFRSIFSLPLIVGIICFFLCGRKKIPVVVTAAGFLAALAALLASVDYESAAGSRALCYAMIASSCAGALLISFSALRYAFKNDNVKNAGSEPK